MSSRWLLVAAAACLLRSAGAGLRVALYTGASASANSKGNFTELFRATLAACTLDSCDIERLELLDGPAVAALTRAEFDVVVFPGGSGSGQASALGPDGKAAVESFVAAGGGLYATCAGGYLVSMASCCDVALPGYCGGKTGCHRSSYGLGLIDLGVAEPWDRGHGEVSVLFTASAVAELRLPAEYADKGVAMLYWQGPIADRAYLVSGNYTAGAYFLTEIASKHPEQTKGQMAGTPAVMLTTYGKGRVLVSPPHPEETQPRLDDVVLAYLRWAGGML